MAAAAATSVVVLDRGNNTTCTINLHGKCVFYNIHRRFNLSNAINNNQMFHIRQLLLITTLCVCVSALCVQVFQIPI